MTSLSVAVGLVIGFSAGVGYALVVALCLIYGILATSDSAAITAGTVYAAAPGQRGATLAVHSFIGFMGGIIAPPVVGAVLDFAGRDTVDAWGYAFFAVAFGSLMALVAVAWRRR